MVLLTGPSGSGKSTLAALLARRGWGRIDGDALAKTLYVPGSALLRRVARAFGPGVLSPDGGLDAQRLGAAVFKDPRARRRLGRLVYGPFLGLLKRRVREARRHGGKWVVEAAVYFDMGAPDLGMPVALVAAPVALRVRRLRALGLPPARALARARALRFGPAEHARAQAVLDGTRTPRRVLADFLDAFGGGG